MFRSKLMLLGNEPMLALEDLNDVMEEEPDNVRGYCIKVINNDISGRCMK